MPKGQEQVTQAADLCRALADEVAGLAAPAGEWGQARAQLEDAADRLRAIQGRFFVKMAPALRFTAPCLAAAEEVRAALSSASGSETLAERLSALLAAIEALEERANAPGGMTIT